jgi:hypothetical protein
VDKGNVDQPEIKGIGMSRDVEVCGRAKPCAGQVSLTGRIDGYQDRRTTERKRLAVRKRK